MSTHIKCWSNYRQYLSRRGHDLTLLGFCPVAGPVLAQKRNTTGALGEEKLIIQCARTTRSVQNYFTAFECGMWRRRGKTSNTRCSIKVTCENNCSRSLYSQAQGLLLWLSRICSGVLPGTFINSGEDKTIMKRLILVLEPSGETLKKESKKG